MMRHNRKGYIDPLPYEIYEKIKDFRDAYDAILDYHAKYITPELEVKGMDIVQVCHLLCRCLTDPAFDVYKRYAVLAQDAMDTLSTYYLTHLIKPGDIFIDPLDIHAILPLDQYVEQPILHLAKYDITVQSMITVVLHEMNERVDVQTELTKILAKTSILLENFGRIVDETYKIHRMKALVVVGIETFSFAAIKIFIFSLR